MLWSVRLEPVWDGKIISFVIIAIPNIQTKTVILFPCIIDIIIKQPGKDRDLPEDVLIFYNLSSRFLDFFDIHEFVISADIFLNVEYKFP